MRLRCFSVRMGHHRPETVDRGNHRDHPRAPYEYGVIPAGYTWLQITNRPGPWAAKITNPPAMAMFLTMIVICHGSAQLPVKERGEQAITGQQYRPSPHARPGDQTQPRHQIECGHGRDQNGWQSIARNDRLHLFGSHQLLHRTPQKQHCNHGLPQWVQPVVHRCAPLLIAAMATAAITITPTKISRT